MFALVRFPNEFRDKVYVVSTRNIKEFDPSDDTDFDPSAVYQAFWDDPEHENSGYYSAQILMMAESEEGLQQKRSAKRVRKARIYASEYEAEEAIDEPVTSQAAQRKERQEKKTQKENRQSAKDSAYADILKKQLESSKKKNAESIHLNAPVPKKRRQEVASSDTETDDSIMAVSSSQLKLKNQEIKHWRQRYEEKSRENARLQKVIESLQNGMDGKLDSMLKLLERQGRAQQLNPLKLSPDHTSAASWMEDAHPSPSWDEPTAPVSDVTVGFGAPVAVSTASATGSNGVAKSKTKTSSWLSSADSGRQRQPQSTDVVADYNGPKNAPPFSTLENGRFHLKGGVTISETQRKTIYANKKAAKTAKDTAQALWGSKKLNERTYGGRLAPKDRKNLDATARKELTPEKVSLVFETLAHWGRTENVDITSTVANMNTVLSEKIQDTRKAFKRRALLQ
ncbi:uncharacterized protein ISCGN_004714 [Ixodes scapularis]